MRPLVLLIIAIAFVAPVAASSAATADMATVYEEANAAYEAQDYSGAYEAYLSIVDDEGYAPDLFFNLGNAAYRLENPGEAALWYRRALVLKPSHAEARQNLRFLEREFGYLEPERNLFQQIVDTFSRRQLVSLAVAGSWGIALSLVAAFVLRRPRWGSATVIAGTVSTFLLVAAALALFARTNDRLLLERSVVTAPETAARTGPADDSKDVISLPPGTQVDRLAQRATWLYVAIPGDLRGWVRADELSPLWPYDSSFLE